MCWNLSQLCLSTSNAQYFQLLLMPPTTGTAHSVKTSPWKIKCTCDTEDRFKHVCLRGCPRHYCGLHRPAFQSSLCSNDRVFLPETCGQEELCTCCSNKDLLESVHLKWPPLCFADGLVKQHRAGRAWVLHVKELQRTPQLCMIAEQCRVCQEYNELRKSPTQRNDTTASPGRAGTLWKSGMLLEHAQPVVIVCLPKDCYWQNRNKSEGSFLFPFYLFYSFYATW